MPSADNNDNPLNGSSANDLIDGLGGNDSIYGFDDNDTLLGGDGNDLISGGDGNDSLTGGTGSDTFRFDFAPHSTTNVDTITDFLSGTDKIQLDGAIFFGLLSAGQLASSKFLSGAAITATSATLGKHILYNTSNGSLYYDLDGAGGNDAVKFAVLQGNPALVYTDIGVTSTTYTGNPYGETLPSTFGPDTLDGLGGNDTLNGDAGDDSLLGGEGDDSLDGSYGKDTMAGGNGNDVYYVDDAGDIIVEPNGDPSLSGYDTLWTSVTYTLPDNVENGYINTSDAVNLTGNGLDNALGAGTGNNIIDGGGGNDTVKYEDGHTGNDGVNVSLAITTSQVTGGSGNDTLLNIENLAGTSHNDTLTGNIGANQLYGGKGNDVLSGGDGNDTLYEVEGHDTLAGGGGVDTLSYVDAQNSISIDLAIATQQTNGGLGSVVISGIENVIGGEDEDTISGDALNNYLAGGDGADVLNGRGGNDTLDGGAGGDAMTGGDGSDVYYVDHNDDDVIEGNANADVGGYDDVKTWISYVLPANVENGFIMSASHINLTGNELSNYLGAGAGNNLIDGGDGYDTVNYAYGATSGVNVSLAVTTQQVTGGSGNDTLLGIENLIGSDYNDTLSGNGDNNELYGLSGNDIINGAGGNDVIYETWGNDSIDGGTGTDTLSFITHTANITVDLTKGAVQQNTGAGLDTIVGIENLEGGSGNDTLIGDGANNLFYGNEGADSLVGGEGKDTLDGGGGADTMVGGLGADTYYVDDAGDVVTETSTTESASTLDQVYSGLAAYTLPANVEVGIITLAGPANITGNSGANTLIAGPGNNVITGGGGIDVASYTSATSAVTLDLGITGEQPTGGSGNDTLVNIFGVVGSAYNDKLTGTAGSNVLMGYDGNDTLLGLDGNDLLTETYGDDSIDGGGGTDTLSYTPLTVGVEVDLNNSTSPQNTGGAGNDLIVGIENLHGGTGGDKFTGDGGNNQLTGGFGNDTLIGGAGDDVLIGDAGFDSLTGGDGADVFSFSNQALLDSGVDTIVDFLPATDKLRLDNNAFTALIGVGTLNAGRLRIGAGITTAGDTNDHLIYNSTTGDLYYDADGSISTVSPVLIATLQGAPALTANDIEMVGLPGLTKNGTDDPDTILGTYGHDTLNGLGGGDYIIGSEGNDILSGGAGHDTLNGSEGADTMTGGDGSDYYYVDNADDQVVETNADSYQGGYDTVFVSISSYTLPPNVESASFLTLGGANLTGNELNNYLTATAGNNVMNGGTGSDTVNYYGATIDGTIGVTLDLNVTTAQTTGGSGSDTLIDIENLYGTQWDDKFTGTAASNYFVGYDGNDTLLGGGGNDSFYESTGAGNDLIDGGDGVDWLGFGAAAVHLTVDLNVTTPQPTGAGTDTILNIEHLSGSEGNDHFTGNDEDNHLYGEEGDDTLIGNDGHDWLDGGSGEDAMVGGAGHDLYYVDHYGDEVVETDDDPLTGGWDTVYSTLSSYTLGDYVENGYIKATGAADLWGNSLHNTLGAGPGNNYIDGGEGSYDDSGGDSVSYYDGVTGTTGVTVSLLIAGPQNTGGSGWDELYRIENVFGTAYDDHLTGDDQGNSLGGSTGNDTLLGGVGDDYISEETGNDVLDGGSGNDTLAYNVSGINLTVNLSLTTAQNTGAGTDTITNFEHLHGGKGNDVLTGNALGNYLYGNEGNDALIGGDGDDSLDGGSGNDTLTGGNGSDRFQFHSAHVLGTDVDTIVGFTTGNDRILLDNYHFTSLGGVGTLAATRLRAGAGITTAADATDYLIYDTTSGFLYYDADGSGTTHAATHFATLQGAPVLNYYDIETTGVNGITLVGTAGNDTLPGGGGNDSLSGLDGHDSLVGGEGRDTLDGGTGNDTMVGGDSDDYYIVQDAGDVVTEVDAVITIGGWDVVYSHLPAYTLPANVERGEINIGGAANLTGNALDNWLAAGTGDNVIDGSGGIDTVDYTDSSVTSTGVNVNLTLTTAQVTGGSGNDTLLNIENVSGTSFDDTLTGTDGANQLYGNGGNDTLIGAGGNDSLHEAAGGNDFIDGGDGVDYLFYTNVSSGITINLGTTTQQTTGGAGNDTIINIEHLYGGKGHDNFTGNALANSFYGNSGNDTLIGDAGNDTLDGGSGSDSLSGGDGSDIYVVDDAGDVVVETNADSATGGIDSVTSRLGSYTLGANVENGTIDTSIAANLTGNTLNNVITAGAGNNVINGGDGTDWVYYNAATAGVSVSLNVTGAQATGGSGTDTLTNIENLYGSQYNDWLEGNAGSNYLHGYTGNDNLIGGSGNDTLDGGTGSDTLQGGDGNDLYYVDSVSDVVLETSSTSTGGFDTIYSSATTYTLPENVEYGYIIGTGTAELIGNSLNNLLGAGKGNNVLNGGAGNDTVSYFSGVDGGSGAIVNLSITTAQVTGGSGNDTLISIENLNGSNNADHFTGNALDNVFVGNDGNDTLLGAGGNDSFWETAGNDSIDGGAGIDALVFGTAVTTGITIDLHVTSAQNTGVATGTDTILGIEELFGGSGNDNFTGDGGDNHLEGGSGNDTLTGGGGNDTIVGGNGNDSLTGDTGADTFIFFYALDAANNVDVISDFAVGEDKLLLRTSVFAAFKSVGELTLGNLRIGSGVTVAADADDFLLFDTSTGHLYYDQDGNLGTHNPIKFATLQGVTTLSISDIDVGLSLNTVSGSTGGDSVIGTSGDDLLDAGAGNDTLNGGDGDDVLRGGTGNDAIYGGPGIDTADFSTANANATVELRRNKAASDGEGGSDTLFDIENLGGGASSDMLYGNDVANVLKGGDGDDVLSAFGGNDTLFGGAGDDMLRGGANNDYLDGGDGIDTADYMLAGGGVHASLQNGMASNDGSGGVDTLVGVENLMGGAYNDVLTGNAEANRLEGNKGNDTLHGKDGADYLNGGLGNDLLNGGLSADVLVGGRGADDFVFDTALGGSNIDQILDFESGTDTIQLYTLVFNNLPSVLAAGNFRSGTSVGAAGDGDDYLFYDTSNGKLYYDASGTASSVSGMQQIVTLVGTTTLVLGDIEVMNLGS